MKNAILAGSLKVALKRAFQRYLDAFSEKAYRFYREKHINYMK
jgi:hypothetical protein